MKKAIYVVLLVIIVFVGYILTSSNTMDTAQSKKTVSKKDEVVKVKKSVNDKDLEKLLSKINEDLKKLPDVSKIKIDKDIPLEEDKKVVTDIFQDISIDSVDTIEKKDGIKPVAAVLIAPNKISSLNIGDTVELPLLGNSNYRVKITNKVVNPSGSVSVSGNLEEDEKYSVVLTQSKTSAYASVTTPEGAYEIESIDGKGYVYSVSDIEKKRVDHSHSDVILPNQ